MLRSATLLATPLHQVSSSSSSLTRGIRWTVIVARRMIQALSTAMPASRPSATAASPSQRATA